MFSFLKKDVLILIRDKKELAILLLMPFLLIAILGFALGSFMESSSPELDMTVIIVNEDDAEAGADRFKRELGELPLPDEAFNQLIEAADQLMPQNMLKAMLASEELSDMLLLKEMDREAAQIALEQDEANAALILPADFTYDTLNKMLLNRGEGGRMDLKLSDASALRAGVFHDMMESFVQTVNFQSALGQSLGNSGEHIQAIEPIQIEGDIENISQYQSVSSMQYYTFGMVVMFVLFVAVSISSGAFTEKTQFTYNRILISGANPLKFLAGKAMSCALLVFLQVMILIGLSSLIFQTFAGQPASFWIEMLIISIVLSLCIGAISALLTAISYRLESKTITDGFASMFVMLLAFFGGSFFPISQMSDLFSAIGEWTPNGAALTSFLQVVQGAEADRWLLGVYRLIGTAAICMLLSIAVYPKRRLK